MKKRMLSLVLAICMLVALLPAGMLAGATDSVVYTYDFAGFAKENGAAAMLTATAADTENYGGWAFASQNSKPGYNGDVFISGKDKYYAVSVEIGAAGAYSVELAYNAWASTGEGSVHIAPADVAAADAITDAYKVIDIPEYRVAETGLTATAEDVMLAAGNYNIYFVHRGSFFSVYDQENGKWNNFYVDTETGETVAGTNDRYTIFNSLELTKTGAYSYPADSLTLSGAKIVGVGKTVTLSAEILPAAAAGQDITWTSDNETVATVANGVVTGVANGTATITAAAGGKSDSVKVTVGTLAGDYEIQDFAIAKGKDALKNATATDTEDYGAWAAGPWDGTPGFFASSVPAVPNVVSVGKHYSIKVNVASAGVYTAQAIYDTWTSSSDGDIYITPSSVTDIAEAAVAANKIIDIPWSTVNANDLVAEANSTFNLAAGEYTLWIKTEASFANNTYVNPETGETETGSKDRYFFIDALRLYKVGDIPAESVSISGAPAILKKGATATLTATVLPAAAPQTVTWDSLNKDIATVNENGVVTGLKDGTATITATADGKTASVTIKVATVLSYQIQAFAASLSDTSVLNSNVSATDTANYGGWSFTGARSTALNLISGKVLMGNGYYGINITIADNGIYQAKMIYDTLTSSCDGEVFIAPYGTNNGTDAQYKVVDIPWATANGDDLAVTGEEIFLAAGDYTVYFKANASYSGGSYTNPETGTTESGNKDRYLCIDELQLVKVGGVLETTEGAAVRIKAPTGLRFFSSISNDLISAADVVEYGTVLMPTADLDGDIANLVHGYTKGTHAVAEVKAVNLYKTTDDAKYFTAVLHDIPVKYYDRSITARAYAKLADGTYIYGATSTARSIYEVAKNGLASDTASATEKEAFQTIVDAYLAQ